MEFQVFNLESERGCLRTQILKVWSSLLNQLKLRVCLSNWKSKMWTQNISWSTYTAKVKWKSWLERDWNSYLNQVSRPLLEQLSYLVNWESYACLIYLTAREILMIALRFILVRMRSILTLFQCWVLCCCHLSILITKPNTQLNFRSYTHRLKFLLFQSYFYIYMNHYHKRIYKDYRI